MKKGICVKIQAGSAGGLSGGSISVCGGKKGFFKASGKCIKVSTGRVSAGLGSAFGRGRFSRPGPGFGRRLLVATSAADGGVLVLVPDVIVNSTDADILTTADYASDSEVVTDGALLNQTSHIDIYPYVDTADFQNDFDSATCAEGLLTDLLPEIDPHIAGCASDEQYPDFCLDCVIPLMETMTTVSHAYFEKQMTIIDGQTMLADDGSWESAMRAKCGADVVEYMVAKGVVADDDFNDRVMGCMIYTGNPECPAAAQLQSMDTEQLSNADGGSAIAAISGETFTVLFDACKAKAAAIKKEFANGTVVEAIVDENDAEVTDLELDYCASCYWPYMKILVNNGVSDGYWCDFKRSDLYNDSTGQPQNLPDGSVETLSGLANGLYNDTGFVACLGSARAYFHREGPAADPFSYEFNRLIRSNCWTPGAVPSIDEMLLPRTVDLINALTCDA